MDISLNLRQLKDQLLSRHVYIIISFLLGEKNNNKDASPTLNFNKDNNWPMIKLTECKNYKHYVLTNKIVGLQPCIQTKDCFTMDSKP